MKTKIWILSICCIILALTLSVTLIPRNDKSYAAEESATYIVLDGGVYFSARKNGTGDTFYSNGADIMPDVVISGNEYLEIKLNRDSISSLSTYTYIDKYGNTLTTPPAQNTSFNYTSMDIVHDGVNLYMSSGGVNQPATALKLSFGSGSTPLFVSNPNSTDLSGNQYTTYEGDLSGLWTITYRYAYGSNTDGTYTYKFRLINAKDYTSSPGSALTFTNVSEMYNTDGIKQVYAYNYGKVDGYTTLYPTITYNPNKFKLTFIKTINDRATTYEQVLTTYDSTVSFNVTAPNGTVTTSPIATYDSPNNTATVVIKDLGYYTFSVDFISAGRIISSSALGAHKTNEDKSLLFFGFNTMYTDLDGNLQPFYTDTLRSSVSSKLNTSTITTETESLDTPNESSEVISTNQDPVRFEYLGQVSSISVNEAAQSTSLVPSFSKDGTYTVVINYSYKISNTLTIYGSQTFTFKIDKSLPDYMFAYKDGSDYKKLQQEYINKDVYLLVKNSDNQFDSPVTASVSRAGGYSSNTYSLTNIALTTTDNTIKVPAETGETYNIYAGSITENDKYQVTLYYGTNNAAATHSFIIDKNPISNINANIPSQANNGTYTEASTYDALQSDSILKTTDPRYITWSQKASGARIKTSYYFISLRNTGSAGVVNTFGTAEGITNGYAFDEISAKTLYNADTDGQYSKDTVLIDPTGDDEPRTISPYNVFNANGLYVLILEDAAGNIATRAILYDKTAPYIYYSTYGGTGVTSGDTITDFSEETTKTSQNIVNNTTLVKWGNYKTLTIDSDINDNFNSIMTAFLNDSIFADKEDQKYVNIDIAQSGYTLSTNGATPSQIVVNAPGVIVYKNQADRDSKHATLNEDTKYLEAMGEGTYDFTINSPRGITNSLQIEMNLDESMLSFYAYNDDANPIYFSTGSATNLNDAYLTFQESTINRQYEIESITIDYYPFSTLEDSSDYPFSQVATKYVIYAKDGVKPDGYTTEDSGYITSSITEDNIKKFKTSVINSDGTLTRPGKYIITRTYTSNENNSNGTDYGDDRRVRNYLYIIDRNEIVSTDDHIGDEILIVLADAEGNTETISFNNWARNTSDGLFVTNKLPVGFYAPYTKYYYTDGNNAYKSSYYFAYLDLTLSYTTTGRYPTTTTYTFTSNQLDTSSNHTLFPSSADDRALVFFPISRNQNINLNNVGSYSFTLTDHTGNDTYNIPSITFSRTYTVRHNAPSLDILTSANGSQENILELINGTYYTNIEDNGTNGLQARFTDPADPYSASVKYLYVTKYAKDGIELSSTTIQIPTRDGEAISITQGEYILNGTLVSTQVFNGINYYQYRFVVNLAIDDEYTYVFTCSYIGEDETNLYTIDGEDFSKATYTVRIDRTKPDTNVNELIANDSYLRGLIGQGGESAFKNNTDTSTLPTLENYYLYANNSFVVEQEPDEYGYFYIREFNSNRDTYTTDFNTIIATHLGFTQVSYSNRTFRDVLSSINTFSRDYGLFEIVEIDYAGNYRVYIVFVESNDLSEDVFNLTIQEDESIDKTTNNTVYLSNIFVTDIYSYNNWYRLSVNGEEVSFGKNTSVVNRNINLNNINNVFASSSSSQVQYTITYTSSCGVRQVNVRLIPIGAYTPIPSPDYEIIIGQNGAGNRTYRIHFTKDLDLIRLSTVSITYGDNTIASYDSYDEIPEYLDVTNSGAYTITYSDNFTQKTYSSLGSSLTYSYTLYVGINNATDAALYEFDNTYLLNARTYYTSGNVTITNNTGLDLRVNGIKIDTTTYVLELVDNQTTSYTVEYVATETDQTYNNLTRTFVITNVVPEISFYDVSDDSPILFDMDSANNTTSKNLYITWGDSPLTDYRLIDNFAARYYVYNGDSRSEAINYSAHTNIYNSGTNKYEFEIYNVSLGYSTSVTFTMTDNRINMYTVLADNVTLSPSPSTLDISNVTNLWNALRGKADYDHKSIMDNLDYTSIPQYFTYSRNIEVDLNVDNNLEAYYIGVKSNSKSETTYDSSSIVAGGDLGSIISNLMNARLDTDYITIFVIINGNTNVIYNNLLAITIVPTSSSFTTVTYTGKDIRATGELTANTRILTSKEVYNSTFDLNWGAYDSKAQWYNRNNIYYMSYAYAGQSNDYIYDESTISNAMISTTVQGSGVHTIRIHDWAGNTLSFSGASQCSITVLDEVVTLINGEQPVANMIYNTRVTVTIDSTYINNYVSGSVSLIARRNGSVYTNFTQNGNSFLFAETGRYEILVNGQYVDGTQLNENNINFSIINASSSRLAWEFTRQPNTYISRVLLDGMDITSRVQADLGTSKISNLYLSSNNYGRGTYTITANTSINSLVGEKSYTFSVRINDETPVIESNPGKGGSTTGKITLTYNPGQIYDQIGTSMIRILTYDSKSSVFTTYSAYIIDSSYAGQNYLANIDLTQTNTYFVQLVTDNGNVILSFKVTRKEPLNTIAIILIVVSAVTVVVLTIIFIKLRTRMKVR